MEQPRIRTIVEVATNEHLRDCVNPTEILDQNNQCKSVIYIYLNETLLYAERLFSGRALSPLPEPPAIYFMHQRYIKQQLHIHIYHTPRAGRKKTSRHCPTHRTGRDGTTPHSNHSRGRHQRALHNYRHCYSYNFRQHIQ